MRAIFWLERWQRQSTLAQATVGLDWALTRINRFTLKQLWRYALAIHVPHFRLSSVFGFALLVAIVIQMTTGLLLSLYYNPDPSFVINFRSDYGCEVWWYLFAYKLHLVGVDVLFALSYAHLAKKLYLRNYVGADIDGWFTGVYAFLIYHLVVFLGITLSTNHLGDVTVTIAANMFWSLMMCWHRSYTIFFGNKHLSLDQLIRFMLAHYVCAWYYTYLVQTHIIFIHEAWDADSNRSARQDTTTPKASWGWDALKKEVLNSGALYGATSLFSFNLVHPSSRAVDFSFFEQWSETEMEEINFFIVAPHWYFRPHMGLLTVCAQHYEGLAWLLCFYLLLGALPQLNLFWARAVPATPINAEAAPRRQSPVQDTLFICFVASLIFIGGSLPCGRFYYEAAEGFFGHSLLRASYEYLYLYLAIFAHVGERLEQWYAALAVRYGLTQPTAESTNESVAAANVLHASTG